MTHLYFIPVYILAYFTGARAMFSLLVHADQPRITKVVHSHHQPAHEERDLDLSRNWRVGMAFLWVPLIIVTVAVIAGLGTYKYVTKPMVTPAERHERNLRKRAEVERAVADAERELAATREMVPHHLPQVTVDDVPQSGQPCHCLFCNGRVGYHGAEAVALHRARVAEHVEGRRNDGRY